MSEDNENQNSEIIESEIVQAPDSTDEVDENAPVIIKKGGFLSFIAFLLAASSMTVSVYLYMQLQNKNDNSADVNTWQETLAVSDNNSEQKFNQLSKQIQQIQKTNSNLQIQLGKIEQIATNNPTTGLSNTDVPYDDSQLILQYQNLVKQLASQNEALNQLKTAVSEDKLKHDQSFQELSQKLTNPIAQPKTNTIFKRNFRYDMAESYLEEAHKQLNIFGDFNKGVDYLNKTLKQLEVLEGIEYHNLKLALQEVSEKTLQNPPIDVQNVNAKINELASLSANLTINQSAQSKDVDQNNQKESSWYDKLIVIRKVEDSTDTKLTNDEQEKVFQDMKGHYNTMKTALLRNQQSLWDKQIVAIESLLNQHFSSQSTAVLNQLSEFKTMDINPVYPDVSPFLETIQMLNRQDAPLENNLISNPISNDTENQ